MYGYGRILVNYDKMRKDGVEFWDVFFGKPLCVAVYHMVTDRNDLTPAELVNYKMLPSQMIMDNCFYYGECEIIGNLPIDSDEDNAAFDAYFDAWAEAIADGILQMVALR